MALGNADDAASDDNAPSPFAPSLASFEQHGFVVVRSALDPSVADEVLVHVNTELEKRQELGLEGVEHDVFGAIAPPKSSTSGYGAPVLHRWNLLLDLEHVTKRSLREVLGRSIDQRPPILENEDCQTRTTDVHREFVWSLIQGACGPGAELCDLSALVSDPGSEEQRLHYDTRNDEVDGGDGGIQASAATENIDPVRDGGRDRGHGTDSHRAQNHHQRGARGDSSRRGAISREVGSCVEQVPASWRQVSAGRGGPGANGQPSAPSRERQPFDKQAPSVVRFCFYGPRTATRDLLRMHFAGTGAPTAQIDRL